MAGKSKGLGKGLDVLIPIEELDVSTNTDVTKQTVAPDMYVKITKVEPNPNQPRKQFDEDKLQELADSIKRHGIIQPIIVQDRNDHYEIVAGERRWRAAMKAGLKQVPVIIRNFTEKEIMEISLIENIQREDLNPIEEAIAYKTMLTKYNLKQDEVAEIVAKSRTTVTNSMRLLNLCDEVQQMLINEMISQGHARALLAIEDKEMQYTVAQRVFDEKLTVRDIEKIVKDMSKPKKKDVKNNTELDFLYKDFEEKLKIALGTKVSVLAKDDEKGKIEIEYYSKSDLERLLDLLINIK